MAGYLGQLARLKKRDAAKLAIIEVEQTLLADTVRAFIEVHRAKSKVEISTSNVEEHERLSDIIKRRVDAATSPEVDLRLAKARLAFSKSQLLRNGNALEAAAKAELEQLIGRAVHRVAAPIRADLTNLNLSQAEKLALLSLLRSERSEPK